MVTTSPGATAPGRLLAALVTELTERAAETGESTRTELFAGSAT